MQLQSRSPGQQLAGEGDMLGGLEDPGRRWRNRQRLSPTRLHPADVLGFSRLALKPPRAWLGWWRRCIAPSPVRSRSERPRERSSPTRRLLPMSLGRYRSSRISSADGSEPRRAICRFFTENPPPDWCPAQHPLPVTSYPSRPPAVVLQRSGVARAGKRWQYRKIRWLDP